ncbi:hypothetical protein [Haladaptatus sp. DFWS20]|uniref:hypothetical protein n=1 Tax=Haladaptatus sp. DFWS20 TaxID=3403467 RepID=UPI003EBB9559
MTGTATESKELFTFLLDRVGDHLEACCTTTTRCPTCCTSAMTLLTRTTNENA